MESNRDLQSRFNKTEDPSFGGEGASRPLLGLHMLVLECGGGGGQSRGQSKPPSPL